MEKCLVIYLCSLIHLLGMLSSTCLLETRSVLGVFLVLDFLDVPNARSTLVLEVDAREYSESTSDGKMHKTICERNFVYRVMLNAHLMFRIAQAQCFDTHALSLLGFSPSKHP